MILPLSKERIVCTSRASVGIFAVLRSLFSNGEVVVPVNICPAAVYPIVYSGNVPVFCDIADYSGNVSLPTISKVVTERTRAILVPHMYGNPVSDIDGIKSFCQMRGLVLIEDCASAMGATIGGSPVGSFGDYSIFSTGHAKVVDIGGGGIVYSQRDCREIVRIIEDTEKASCVNTDLENDFAACYRRYLNTRGPLSAFSDQDFFKKDFSSVFVRRPKFCSAEHIVNAVQRFVDSAVRFHRDAQARMELCFSNLCPAVRMYQHVEGSVPWRFSFFIDRLRRQKIADRLLEAHIPVSDWYPPIGELFGEKRLYSMADRMGNEILNLPHFLDEKSFMAACKIVSEFC